MNEFDQLLKTLRSEEPRPEDVARWKMAIQKLAHAPRSRWMELVAAMLIGVLIGATAFQPKSKNDEGVSQNATIEHIVTKLE